MPPYAVSILFELYETNNGHYLTLFYKKIDEEDPLPLNIPGCGTKCPLEKFIKINAPFIPTKSFDVECQLNSD